MPSVKMTRNSFNSGELDPLLSARFNVKALTQGAKTLQNVVCLPQGGVRRRGGLAYIDEITDGDARLIPFAFNITQTYLLVFGDGKLYIYKDGVLQTNINASGFDYLTVPWSISEIHDCGWTQSADTLIVCHKDHAPRTITRGASHTSWTLATISFPILPAEDFNKDYDSTSFTLAAKTGTSINLTASTSVFTAEHVGGRFEGASGIAEITAYGSGTSVTVRILKDFDSTSVQGKRAWLAEPAWSTEHGYPSVVTFHEGRLWMAGTDAQPQTLWASVTNDFYNFDYGTGLDDEAIGITLDTDQVNAIQHLVSIRHLQIFTTGGEFYISDSPITPSDSNAKRQTRFGSTSVRPAVIDGSTVFIQRTGKVVREYLYSWAEDAYTAESASLLASHLISSPTDMSAQRGTANQDANYVYLVTGDGNCAVYNTLREQEIAAWSHWESQAVFKRVCVVEDDVYFLMLFNSGYYLAKIDNDTYTDLNMTFTSHGSAVVTGLDHLDTFAINVLADGSVLSDETVASNQITMDRSGDDVEVGLQFDLEIETLPLSVDYPDGPTYSAIKRIPAVYVDMYESLGVVVGGYEIANRQFGSGVLDGVPTPWSGIKRVRILGWDREKTVPITQTGPLPFTLRSLTLEVET